MATQWFLQDGDKVAGPWTPAQLKSAAASGVVKPDSRVRREGDKQWFPAANVQGLFEPASGASSISRGAVGPSRVQAAPVAPSTAPAATPAPNPFAATSAAPPAAPFAGNAAPVPTTSAEPVGAAPATGGPSSLVDVIQQNPALQFGVAAAGAGIVTFALAMLVLMLFRGRDPEPTPPGPAVAQNESSSTTPAPPSEPTSPAVAEATPASVPTPPSPAETPVASRDDAPTAPPANAGTVATSEAPAVAPRETHPPGPSDDEPGSSPAPLEPPGVAERPSSGSAPGEMKPPAVASVDPPARDDPATPPEPSRNSPTRSLADLAPPSAGTKQKESFDARMKRLREIHTLHANSIREWRELEDRRGPLISKGESLTTSIQNLQRYVAEWQAELAHAQIDYQQATAAYNAASDAAGRNLAQRDGALAQQRAGQAESRIREYTQRAQREQAQLLETQKQLNDVVTRSTKLITTVDDSAPEWLQLCDPFGKLGPSERASLVAQFGTWVREEPDLAYTYLGRAAVAMGGDDGPAAEIDLNEAERLDPRMALVTKPMRGYLLARGKDAKLGMTALNEATKDAGKAWLPFLLRGRVLLEQGEYGRAENDLEKATKFGTDVADAHESLAMLLAACPQGSIVSGKRALAAATKACELTKNQDWRALDALAAASAESGDFVAAEKHARAAIELAAAEFAPPLEERLKLYQAGQPYRLPPVEKRDR